MFSTLGILILILLLIAFWYSTMKSKEIAVQTAKALCDDEHVLLLDDTVALKKLWFARNDHGRVCFKRIYSFEYSLSNQQRYNGHIVIIGKSVIDHGLTISPTRFDDTPDPESPSTDQKDNVLEFKSNRKNLH